MPSFLTAHSWRVTNPANSGGAATLTSRLWHELCSQKQPYRLLVAAWNLCVFRLSEMRWQKSPCEHILGPENCFAGGGWHGCPAKEGGAGVPKMGFRAGPFVSCKDGCCHQRCRNTNFGLEKVFSLKNFPPHMCSQNDQRDVGIILSHVCWGRPPPPGTEGWEAPAQTPLLARRPRRGRGGLGKWASVPSRPRKAIFFPPWAPLRQGWVRKKGRTPSMPSVVQGGSTTAVWL